MHWSDRYLNIPYSECDCAELAARVAREVFSVEVRLPTERSTSRGERSRTIGDLKADFAARVKAPNDGDPILMMRGSLYHVGVSCVIGGRLWVLHNTSNTEGSTRLRFGQLADFGYVTEGFYRWL